jgi:hypothetical protein
MRLVVATLNCAILGILLTGPSSAQDAGQAPAVGPLKANPELPYSPYASGPAQTRVYWGDTHLHTGFSMDAGAFGARMGPEDAYRFARGEEVDSATAGRARLARPLDFLVVADHSDNMGFFPDLFAGKPDLLADPTGKQWYDLAKAGGESGIRAASQIIDAFSRGKFPEKLMYWPDTQNYKDAWAKTIAAAEKYNDPGRFTAFIGYEWTSQVPPGQNLHRVIIYRDGADKASQGVPATTYAPHGSTDPEYLWKFLQNYEDKTGGKLLAIAHNGNMSNGLMFPGINHVTKQPITKEYARTRARWEPLYETTQIKGDGEAHPFLSPNDEFADYGTWDKGNLNLSELKKKEMLQYEYARSALKLGLEHEAKLGINPYKFGQIGSTDSHTAMSTADDDNYFGKHAGAEPSPKRIEHAFAKFGDLAIYNWETLASGYIAVWAKDNTRASLFDAMQRKEVYGSTGPRMTVRFFGGWDFSSADLKDRQPAKVGYAKGVPMGGDLKKAPAGKKATFLIAALKDPIGANLDRIQVVKGWMDAKGALQEKVYDVAWSGNRKAGANGKLPAVGNTVDVARATYTNSIGASELLTTWTDRDFDPAERAFYYLRILEIPTPRWTAYDSYRYGVPLAKGDSGIHQERAYTSPIWYTP